MKAIKSLSLMPIGIVYFTIPATNSLTKGGDHVHSNMIEYLNIFVQVVEQGSFTRAADILQIHRPTVSKAIQQIEDDLGGKNSSIALPVS